jgi:TolB-like protein
MRPPDPASPHAMRFARFEVRPAERLLLADGVPVGLGARAFDVLMCLLAHRARVVGKDEMLLRAWPGRVVEENNLSVQVSALRKAIGATAIATVPGRGYRFALPVIEIGAPPPREPHRTDPAPAEPPAIAVLPFRVRGNDPRVALLADGLAEDVIALLARVPGFLLISHASSLSLRGLQASPTEVARQLGVRYVVEGSVRAAGAVLRASAQLVDAATGRVLWIGGFDSLRDTADDLQEDIARGIIVQLEPELTRAEIAHIRRQRPENLDAWAHYHQAVGAIAQQGWGGEAIAEARRQLQMSLAIDPSFGLGHAQYALLTALARVIGVLPDDQGLVDGAMRAADQAVELDHGSSEVLGYAGCALCDLGQKERGLAMLHRALDLDPSNAQAQVGLGAALALTGRPEDGIERLRLGMRISPRDRRLGFWGWVLGSILLRARRADEALAEARTASGRDPRLHLARVLEATALVALGRPVEATSALSAARRLRPELTLAEVATAQGRRAGDALAPLWHAHA